MAAMDGTMDTFPTKNKQKNAIQSSSDGGSTVTSHTPRPHPALPGSSLERLNTFCMNQVEDYVIYTLNLKQLSGTTYTICISGNVQDL